MFKCIFNLDPILTCHDKKLPSSDRCFWASFFQPPWAPIPHPPPQLDAVCFLCCFLLIFSLCGASLLFPFHLSMWCVSISCFLAQNLPSHPVPRSPENMCAMAQLMFGSFLRSVLLNTGSVSLLTKEGVYYYGYENAGYSVVIPSINYSNTTHFSKNILRHEIKLWC